MPATVVEYGRGVAGDAFDLSGRSAVVTVGETMALLDPVGDGLPAAGTRFTLRFAGAETNFAIALARLGVRVSWISRLGRDAFGDMIERGVAAEGVDVSRVRRDDARTGLFVKWRGGEERGLAYYRAGSAASRLRVGDVPDAALDGVRLVHLTGITMALSDSARELVVDVARRARERGALVLFDPNFRPLLPDTPAAARTRQQEVMPHVDWCLTGEDEARLLWGESGPPARTVLRVGHRGAVVDGVHVPPPREVGVVDAIGAGDAFAAGFAYGLLAGWEPAHCAHAGNVLAGRALEGTGDWETLPRLAEVAGELAPAGQARP
jgi:2-dehydro-3-deoxygluconokinase